MKVLLFLVIAGFLIGEASAQNRSIEFRKDEWKKILEVARSENKMIFVDCYTSWCGPCKMLSNTVFTNDSVADFYNQHFINVKVDMEKGEGPELAKRYEVKAFPTLLYVDKAGDLVHCVVGFQPVRKLIQEGGVAMDGGMTLLALQKRYDAGERDPEFVRTYISKLSEAYRPKLQESVATEYINTLTDEQFYTRDCWNIMVYNLQNPLSPLLKKLVKNRARFYQIVAKDTVDMFIDYTFRSKVGGFTWWEAEKHGPFNQKGYDEYVAYLLSLNLPEVPRYLASLYTARKVADGDYRGMLDEMHKALSYGFFYGDNKLSYIQNYIIRLEKCSDVSLKQEAIGWMEALMDEYPVGYYKSEYMRLKARLLKSLGKEKEAADLEAEARVVRMQH